MNRLSSVIGPAPSEFSYEAFKEKLVGERNRVRESLEEFRNRKKKPSPAAKAKGIAASLKKAGLSPADFLKGLEMLQRSCQTTKSAKPEGVKEK